MDKFEKPDLSVIIVSYNTKELTLKALETLFEQTTQTKLQVILLDNDSSDGSADAVEKQFPQVELIRSAENFGFAKGNNVAAERVKADWMLLLNPDTEVQDHAVDKLLDFAKKHPKNGIYGGRTVFPDGSLNIASCWNKMTIPSLLSSALMLHRAFPNSELFNAEAMGSWPRDTVRNVDIVVGCLFLVPVSLWKELNGFDERYFMYGEETDFCLRAKKHGYQPIITPDAQIMHLVGAATAHNDRPDEKLKMVMTAKVSLIQDHWPKHYRSFGITLLKLNIFLRMLLTGGKSRKFRSLWKSRDSWSAGYSRS